MPRSRRRPDDERPPLSAQLAAALIDDNLSPADKHRLIAEFRTSRPKTDADTPDPLDTYLLEQVAGMRGALHAAHRHHLSLEESMKRLMAPPLLPAVYVGPGRAGTMPTAMVAHGTTRRIVTLAEDVNTETLRRGDDVLLNADLSVVVEACPPSPGLGETATVQRRLDDGRLVVRVHDDQLVVEPADALREDPPRVGDVVRWDRAARFAFERLPRETNEEFLLESIPDLALDAVGGQADNLGLLVDALTLALVRPEVATDYGLEALPTVLMVGPPGTGKTLLARVAAAELQRLTGQHGHICIVKPGQFEDPYVGVTQRRIRECFAAMRRAEGFGILFLDEVESVARQRGGLVGHHSDKFLAALLAEMQGFDDDPRRRFAVVACTNRLDLMDPALVERMEVQLFVRRPDMRAARRIFEIHLPQRAPLAEDTSRRAVVEHAVSLLYGPNADNDVCTIQFASGEERSVTTRDLVSGRCIQQICRSIGRGAARRHAAGGETGIHLDDVDEAVAGLREKLAATLTRRNLHCYLDDLPQDQEIVRVDPVSPVHRVHRALVA